MPIEQSLCDQPLTERLVCVPGFLLVGNELEDGDLLGGIIKGELTVHLPKKYLL